MDRLREAAQEQIEQLIQQQLQAELETYDITGVVANMVQQRMDDPRLQQYINAQIRQAVDGIAINDAASRRLEERSAAAVNSYTPQMQQYVRDRVDKILTQTIDQLVKSFSFPQASIHHDAIDFTGCNISRLEGVDKLQISGIESFTQDVQLTMLDDNVVIENTLVANEIKTKKLIVEDLELDAETYDTIKHDILKSVPVPKNYDADIERLETKLSQSKTGSFKELEVSGESLLSDVLYTTPGNRRVGINTMEPSDALTVWDNETEVVIGKHKAQEGYIGTRRRQDINIGANNKVGITVRSDGSVVINKLELLGRTIAESDRVPGYAAKRGDIVLNSKPEPGNPIGWVCLDGIRWSGFGNIN
jgi:siroheme synthase (precorrin-2 oxidase/ferrochelatase)